MRAERLASTCSARLTLIFEGPMAPGPEIHIVRGGGVSPQMVRRQLERLVSSPIFNKSNRLIAFLRYVVEQTLAGQTDLKEQVLASELYGRGVDFDSGLDPA